MLGNACLSDYFSCIIRINIQQSPGDGYHIVNGIKKENHIIFELIEKKIIFYSQSNRGRFKSEAWVV